MRDQTALKTLLADAEQYITSLQCIAAYLDAQNNALMLTDAPTLGDIAYVAWQHRAMFLGVVEHPHDPSAAWRYGFAWMNGDHERVRNPILSNAVVSDEFARNLMECLAADMQ